MEGNEFKTFRFSEYELSIGGMYNLLESIK